METFWTGVADWVATEVFSFSDMGTRTLLPLEKWMVACVLKETAFHERVVA